MKKPITRRVRKKSHLTKNVREGIVLTILRAKKGLNFNEKIIQLKRTTNKIAALETVRLKVSKIRGLTEAFTPKKVQIVCSAKEKGLDLLTEAVTRRTKVFIRSKVQKTAKCFKAISPVPKGSSIT